MRLQRVLPLFGALALLLVMPATWASGGDKDSNNAHIDFVVIRSYNGKPVRNASVILHPVNKDGKESRGGTELKTDPDGKASLDYVPYGTMRIQAIAPGLQTYGNDIEINQPQQQITIKMNRPKDQYSIYK
jgi:Carboxypeptidase regulatory-like domain